MRRLLLRTLCKTPSTPPIESNGRLSGFYIAKHPLFPHNLHKIGFSANLQKRLSDSTYTTCFPSPFSYVSVLITNVSKKNILAYKFF
jgi:hypothetical protein